MSDTEEDNKPKEHPLEAIYRERYERSKKIDEEQDQIPLFMTSDKGKDSDAYRAIQALINECSPDVFILLFNYIIIRKSQQI